jgi:DNA polymerase (family 10)
MLKAKPHLKNQEIADILDEIAGLLEYQQANPHRIRAFRTGARQVRSLPDPIDQIIAEKGLDSLENITGIGKGLTAVIGEYLQTGRSSLLDRLRGEVSPVDLFSQVGGIGEELAERIVRELGIRTLEELEEAAYDGRLARVKGFGEQRLATIRESLSGRLSRASQRYVRESLEAASEKTVETAERPPVSLLLEVDSEYRRKAAAGQLHKITPKRFNPGGEAWLPVMQTQKDGWSFTALYSNTARAHELGKTRDWVVIYYEKGGIERQSTVLTAGTGPLKGQRVVRGREDESRQYYESR